MESKNNNLKIIIGIVILIAIFSYNNVNGEKKTNNEDYNQNEFQSILYYWGDEQKAFSDKVVNKSVKKIVGEEKTSDDFDIINIVKEALKSILDWR